MTDLTPEEALAAAPRLRLTGEQLDGLGHGLGSDLAIDWDEYEDFVPLSALTAQGFAIVRSDELAGLRAALTTIRDGYVYAVGECLWCMASIHAETDHKADCPVTIARSALEGVSR